MDEMRIVTPFMRGIVSKLIKRTLKQKIGRDIDVDLKHFKATTVDNGVKLSMSVEAIVDKETLLSLLNSKK